jgi:hypothetical protein
VTEDEAKTKWCPFARPGAVLPSDCGEVRGNRMMNGAIDSGALCLGSACMAWRRAEGDLQRLELEARVKNPDAVYFVQRAMLDTDGGGYCGLAGAPQ